MRRTTIVRSWVSLGPLPQVLAGWTPAGTLLRATAATGGLLSAARGLSAPAGWALRASAKRWSATAATRFTAAIRTAASIKLATVASSYWTCAAAVSPRPICAGPADHKVGGDVAQADIVSCVEPFCFNPETAKSGEQLASFLPSYTPDA
jgi:hypothetical protein